MSTITVTQLYDQLSDKLGKETAENLTSYMDTKIKEEIAVSVKDLATKEDIAATKEDIAKLGVDIARLSADTIKWSFIFWIGQVAVTYSLLFFLLKK